MTAAVSSWSVVMAVGVAVSVVLDSVALDSVLLSSVFFGRRWPFPLVAVGSVGTANSALSVLGAGMKAPGGMGPGRHCDAPRSTLGRSAPIHRGRRSRLALVRGQAGSAV